jgi:acyl carrier protein
MSDNNQDNLSEAALLTDIRQQMIELDSCFAANPNWRLEDAGLDSFSLLSFALALEQRYRVRLKGEDLQTFSQQNALGLTRLIIANANHEKSRPEA